MKFLVTFLIVVTIGGSNGIVGALFGALLLGVLDVAGKYYVPSIGAFIIYAVMVVDAASCVRKACSPRADDERDDAIGRGGAASPRICMRRARWRLGRNRLLAATLALIFAVPSRAALINEILIAGPVRAVARPHPRSDRNRLARTRGVPRPRRLRRGDPRQRRLRRPDARSRRRRAASPPLVGLVTAPLLLRGADLTRLMVTLGVSLMLGELANRNGWLTGGADGLNFSIGQVLGLFPIGFTGPAQRRALQPRRRSSSCSRSRGALAQSPFGLALTGDPRKPAARRRARHRHQPPDCRDLYGSPRPTPARPARCWRRRRRSSRSTSSTSIARPT